MIRRILATAAILLGSAVAANATTMTLTGYYTVTQTTDSTLVNGLPKQWGNQATITDNLGTWKTWKNNIKQQVFTENLTVNGAQNGWTTFFTAAPTSKCSNKTNGCGKKGQTNYNVAQSTLSVAFTLMSPTGALATISDTGTYWANYTSMTDGIDWSVETLLVYFNDGYEAKIYLPDRLDWNVIPQISFQLLYVPKVRAPEPISISIFGAGLAGVARYRRRQKAKKA